MYVKKNCHGIGNKGMAMGIRDEREGRLNPHSESLAWCKAIKEIRHSNILRRGNYDGQEKSKGKAWEGAVENSKYGEAGHGEKGGEGGLVLSVPRVEVETVKQALRWVPERNHLGGLLRLLSPSTQWHLDFRKQILQRSSPSWECWIGRKYEKARPVYPMGSAMEGLAGDS